MALFNYECDEVKRIIEEVSPNYPQLTTYVSEWLYFHEQHYNPGTPVELEYEAVSVNPTGYVLNAIPYQYKSAILKGQTLVNDVSTCRFADTTKYFEIELNNYKNNQSYMLIMFNAPNNIKRIYVGTPDGSMIWTDYTKDFIKNKNCIMLKITCPSNYDGTNLLPHFKYVDEERPSSINNIKCMLIKYQNGMENWDFPYFEGMQSVQMPVLTTSNEDGTKTNILTVNEDVTLRSNGDVYDELNLLTGRLTQRIDENNEVLAQAVVKTVDLTPLNKPYEGTNHYELTSDIPCEAILEVPVVSTGKQTLKEINN